MYRFAQKEIESWFFSAHRKPLILRGARQVGKSTLVRLTAQALNLRLYEINLERHFEMDAVFESLDMNRILSELEGIFGRIENRDRDLIFLDEIQAAPKALQALRYFYEERPDLAVIAAGSLLEFTLADHNFSMPVGRIEYKYLNPMSFAEYLHASDQELYDFFTGLEQGVTIPSSRHNALLNRQREYLFIGGMPEAVKVWIDTGHTEQVQRVHDSILDTYTDDFAKYSRRSDLVRLQKIFKSLPLHVGKKIKYVNLSKDDKSSQVKEAIDLLCKARICHRIYHSDCTGIPLGASINEKTFKLIFIDTGLMNRSFGLDLRDIMNLEERELINEGSLAEQFIGQELLNRGELYYWIREGKGNNAELDYVTAHRGKIIPMEVKSGSSGSLKSLHQFMFLKKAPKAIRFDLNRPDIQNVEVKVSDRGNTFHSLKFPLITLPLYLAGKYTKWLDI